MAVSEPKRQTPPGPAVDSTGQAVVDPSVNVKELVVLQMKRQDDLRAADNRRQDDLREKSDECLQEIAALRALHAIELREAEAKRIDAIRAVDVSAREAASRESQIQASTLAATVVSSAEALRSRVDAAASAAAQELNRSQESQRLALQQALHPLSEAVAALQKSEQTSAGGRAQVVEARAGSANSSLWIGLAIAAAIGLGTLVIGGLGLIITAVGIWLATRP